MISFIDWRLKYIMESIDTLAPENQVKVNGMIDNFVKELEKIIQEYVKDKIAEMSPGRVPQNVVPQKIGPQKKAPSPGFIQQLRTKAGEVRKALQGFPDAQRESFFSVSNLILEVNDAEFKTRITGLVTKLANDMAATINVSPASAPATPAPAPTEPEAHPPVEPFGEDPFGGGEDPFGGGEDPFGEDPSGEDPFGEKPSGGGTKPDPKKLTDKDKINLKRRHLNAVEELLERGVPPLAIVKAIPMWGTDIIRMANKLDPAEYDGIEKSIKTAKNWLKEYSSK